MIVRDPYRPYPLTLAVVAFGALFISGCGDDGAPPMEPVDETARWTATLTNAEVTSNPQTGASGVAELAWDGTRLSWTIDVSDLTGAQEAHIHGPADRDVDAPVRLWLYNPSAPSGTVNGRLVSGSAVEGSDGLVGVTLTQVLTWMRSDQAHVMVHTQEHPAGEIRGHIVAN